MTKISLDWKRYRWSCAYVLRVQVCKCCCVGYRDNRENSGRVGEDNWTDEESDGKDTSRE